MIDAVAFDEEGQAARLVDENLLPPTQMDFENIAATPLNTRIEDISHWKVLIIYLSFLYLLLGGKGCCAEQLHTYTSKEGNCQRQKE